MFLDQIFLWKTVEESTDKTAEAILVAYIMVEKKKKREEGEEISRLSLASSSVEGRLRLHHF